MKNAEIDKALQDWNVQVRLKVHGGPSISVTKSAILALANSPLHDSVSYEEPVLMLELNPLAYSTMRIEVPLSVLQEVQQERLDCFERPLSEQEILTLIRETPKKKADGSN